MSPVPIQLPGPSARADFHPAKLYTEHIAPTEGPPIRQASNQAKAIQDFQLILGQATEEREAYMAAT